MLTPTIVSMGLDVRRMTVWKVFNINSGRVIKAGFQDEEAAKDWLELRRDLVAWSQSFA